jgi:hypothetical protein
MGQITPITMASVAARDAVTGWDAGDMVFCVSEAVLTLYNGSAWVVIANLDDIPAP